jgi:hypothetical protein
LRALRELPQKSSITPFQTPQWSDSLPDKLERDGWSIGKAIGKEMESLYNIRRRLPIKQHGYAMTRTMRAATKFPHMTDEA